MIDLKVKHDASRADRLLATLHGQTPFVTSLAINNTAKDFQKAQTANIESRFRIRRRVFARRATKIKPFSTKQRLEATVSIDPPGGQARADIFAKFERAHLKRPDGRSIAVPDEARRSKTGVIQRSARPRAFDFERVGGGGGTEVYHGSKRTFMIKRPGGKGGIYQRTGKRATARRRGAGRRMASTIATRRVRDLNVRVLYRFTPYARIDDRLEFTETGTKIVRRRFAANFHAALMLALGRR